MNDYVTAVLDAATDPDLADGEAAQFANGWTEPAYWCLPLTATGSGRPPMTLPRRALRRQAERRCPAWSPRGVDRFR